MSQNQHRSYRPPHPGGSSRGPAPAFSGAEAYKRAGSKPQHTVFSSCPQADRLCSLAKRVESFISNQNILCGKGIVNYDRLRRVQDELFTAVAVFQMTFEKIQNSSRNKGPRPNQARPQQPSNAASRPPQKAGGATSPPRPSVQKPQPTAHKVATSPATGSPAKPAAAPAPVPQKLPTTTAPAAAVKPVVDKPAPTPGNGKDAVVSDKPVNLAEATSALKKAIEPISEPTGDAKAPQTATGAKAGSRFSRLVGQARRGAPPTS